MTATVEPDDRSTGYDGRVFRLGPEWALCSFRLPTAMPIPLAVVEPRDIALETWAFTGMTAQADRPTSLLPACLLPTSLLPTSLLPTCLLPTCLLLLRAQGAAARTALAGGTRLVVATHFHPVAVTTGPAEPAVALSPGDRSVMARAVLSAMTPRNAASLADPITLLAPALRAVPVPTDAPEITLAVDRSAACTVSGTDMPDYVLFDAEAGLRCARVATARLAFSPTPRMDLALEPLWGPETGPPDRTFLIANGRFTAARVRACAA